MSGNGNGRVVIGLCVISKETIWFGSIRNVRICSLFECIRSFVVNSGKLLAGTAAYKRN